MDIAFIVAGVIYLFMGFGRFIYMMEHSDSYSPDAGALHVATAAILIGLGGIGAMAGFMGIQ